MSAPATDLSPRQARIVELASGGVKDLAIAAELGMSFSTCRSHWTKIFARLGVHNRTAACLSWALRQRGAPILNSADGKNADATKTRSRRKLKP